MLGKGLEKSDIIIDALKEEIRQLTNEVKDLRSACNAYRDKLREIHQITQEQSSEQRS